MKNPRNLADSSYFLIYFTLQESNFLTFSFFLQVYQPCVLITKKRYVGYSYESLDQKQPIFDAKGIETVRRDNCPAVEKVIFLANRYRSLMFSCVTSHITDQKSKGLNIRF